MADLASDDWDFWDAFNPRPDRDPTSVPRRWHDWFHDLAGFLLDHDRLPARRGEDNERAIYTWLYHQKDPYERGRLLPHQRALLDLTGIPQTGWLEGARRRAADAEWFARLAEVRAFADEHGRRPGSGTSRPEREQIIGLWLSSNRNPEEVAKKYPERSAALVESGVLDLSHSRSPFLTGPWKERLEEVVTYVLQHGKRPTHASHDRHTKTLGLWLNRQRTHVKRSTLPDEQVALLADASGRCGVDLTAGIDSTSRKEAPGRIAAFYRKHGRFPGPREPDGRWLADARSRFRHKGLAVSTMQTLDAIDPSWKSSLTNSAPPHTTSP